MANKYPRVSPNFTNGLNSGINMWRLWNTSCTTLRAGERLIFALSRGRRTYPYSATTPRRPPRRYKRSSSSVVNVDRDHRFVFLGTPHLLMLTWPKVIDALSLLLPESPLYPVLSTLPPPNPTNPTSTTTSATQEAVHNSLPIILEIMALAENDEDETFKRELDKRRLRLNALGPEELKKEVEREVWGTSKVS